jgi:hypothetical protein
MGVSPMYCVPSSPALLPQGAGDYLCPLEPEPPLLQSEEARNGEAWIGR